MGLWSSKFLTFSNHEPMPTQPTENKRPSESRMYLVRLFQTAFQ
ncbi:hypothetical protein NEIFLAOT_02541 [Neisseria flavescens NRL30031/H210]|uniref:Uncharacterized protein n=1 Tax=Neisseria flavescens NRL30031/H210 TaxID=546264 RepID=C0ERD9_NEIFL|nr:hypothetical protein NEIFLAOT_02541 [Neisseria flavescens NRL30031/H210]